MNTPNPNQGQQYGLSAAEMKMLQDSTAAALKKCTKTGWLDQDKFEKEMKRVGKRLER